MFFVNQTLDDTLTTDKPLDKKGLPIVVDYTTLTYPINSVQTYTVIKHSEGTFSFMDENNDFLSVNLNTKEITTETFQTETSTWNVSIDKQNLATLSTVNPELNTHHVNFENQNKRFALVPSTYITNIHIYRANPSIATLSLTKLPTRTTYHLNETISTAGMVVKAHFSDGTVNPNYTNYTVSATSFNTVGFHTVTVTSTDFPSVSTSFEVETVVAKNQCYNESLNNFGIRQTTKNFGDETYANSPHSAKNIVSGGNAGKNHWLFNGAAITGGKFYFGAPVTYKDKLNATGAFNGLKPFQKTNHYIGIMTMLNFQFMESSSIVFRLGNVSATSPVYGNVAYSTDRGITWTKGLNNDVLITSGTSVRHVTPTAVSDEISYSFYFNSLEPVIMTDIVITSNGKQTQNYKSNEPVGVKITEPVELFINIGQSMTLSAAIMPLNHNEGRVVDALSWSTTNASIVSCTATGTINGVAQGTATIRAKITKQQQYYDEINVHVNYQPTSISVSSDSAHPIYLPYGSEFTYQGLIVQRTYSNGVSLPEVTNDMTISTVDTSVLGPHVVLITDNKTGLTTSYTVVVGLENADIVAEDIPDIALAYANLFRSMTSACCTDNTNSVDWDTLRTEYSYLPAVVRDEIFTSTDPTIADMRARYIIIRAKHEAGHQTHGFTDYLLNGQNAPLMSANNLTSL